MRGCREPESRVEIKTTLEFCFTDHVGFDLWNGEHREGKSFGVVSHENVIGGHYQAGWSAMGYGHLSNVETETFPDFTKHTKRSLPPLSQGGE